MPWKKTNAHKLRSGNSFAFQRRVHLRRYDTRIAGNLAVIWTQIYSTLCGSSWCFLVEFPTLAVYTFGMKWPILVISVNVLYLSSQLESLWHLTASRMMQFEARELYNVKDQLLKCCAAQWAQFCQTDEGRSAPNVTGNILPYLA